MWQWHIRMIEYGREQGIHQPRLYLTPFLANPCQNISIVVDINTKYKYQ